MVAVYTYPGNTYEKWGCTIRNSIAIIIYEKEGMEKMAEIGVSLFSFFLKLAGAFVAGATLGLAAQIPSKYFVNAGVVAAMGWAVYLLTTDAGWSRVWVNYAATVCVALTSQILARKKHVPATVFLIPGIIPLVPGGGMYLIVWSMLYETPAASSVHLYETLQMAGAIAMGIFTVDTFFRIPKKKKAVPPGPISNAGNH